MGDSLVKINVESFCMPSALIYHPQKGGTSITELGYTIAEILYFFCLKCSFVENVIQTVKHTQ